MHSSEKVICFTVENQGGICKIFPSCQQIVFVNRISQNGLWSMHAFLLCSVHLPHGHCGVQYLSLSLRSSNGSCDKNSNVPIVCISSLSLQVKNNFFTTI